MNDNNEDLQESVKNSLQERMASLEATNHFHRETIQEISSSLKEVVKTQHILANQKEEMKKLIADHDETLKTLNEVASQQNLHTMRIDVLELENKNQRTDIDAMAIDLGKQKNRIDTILKVAKGFGTVLVPVISAIIITFIL